jgi:hypothetical protein
MYVCHGLVCLQWGTPNFFLNGNDFHGSMAFKVVKTDEIPRFHPGFPRFAPGFFKESLPSTHLVAHPT